MILVLNLIDGRGDPCFGLGSLVGWGRHSAESLTLSPSRRNKHRNLRVHRRSFRLRA